LVALIVVGADVRLDGVSAAVKLAPPGPARNPVPGADGSGLGQNGMNPSYYLI
jgi:hypothetical protein